MVIRIINKYVELVLPLGVSEKFGYKFLISKEKWIKDKLKNIDANFIHSEFIHPIRPAKRHLTVRRSDQGWENNSWITRYSKHDWPRGSNVLVQWLPVRSEPNSRQKKPYHSKIGF